MPLKPHFEARTRNFVYLYFYHCCATYIFCKQLIISSFKSRSFSPYLQYLFLSPFINYSSKIHFRTSSTLKYSEGHSWWRTTSGTIVHLHAVFSLCYSLGFYFSTSVQRQWMHHRDERRAGCQMINRNTPLFVYALLERTKLAARY